MGLDMYLNIRHKDTQPKIDAYIAWEQKYTTDEFYELSDDEQDAYWDSEPEYYHGMFGKELIYWRKANQIHRWFVQNCQNGIDDCGTYPVTLNQLKELKALCEKIMSMTDVHQEERPIYPNGWNEKPVMVMKDVHVLTEEGVKFAEENLPSQSGFFFGRSDYDGYYLNDIEHTIEAIDEVIDELMDEYRFGLDIDLVTGEYNGDYIIEYTSSW